MQRFLAIVGLTWKAAFRYRLFWVLAGLLIASVVALPLLIKDDGTARGFTQILLTYTLSVITALLGLATLWLSCGTLARDVEECQMQVVAVKPIARWQIWLGKWCGILLINALLLAVAGGSVFFLLQWRAWQLPEAEQAILRNEIFVARASVKEPADDYSADVDAAVQQRLREDPMLRVDEKLLRQQIDEQFKSARQVVPPAYMRRWEIDLGRAKDKLRDQPLFVRVKFHTSEPYSSLSGTTYHAEWHIGTPGSAKLYREAMPSLAPETFHEFVIPPDLFDENGRLTIDFVNRNNTALLFPLEEGLEVLYREGGFALNYFRGLGIILCWLTLLSALGLAAASYLSFPVAAFCSMALLIVGLSSGTLKSVVEEGSVMGLDHETGAGAGSVLDMVIVPVFGGVLKVINLVQGFSPVDALSTGRSVTWGQLTQAVAQIVLLLGGIFAVVGITAFTRRELAAVQTQA